MGSLSLRPGDLLTIPRMALSVGFIDFVSSTDTTLTCPLKTNLNLERESKDSGVCKEAGNDEEAIHERTDYPQAEGSRS
jgi:hypothetical protein